MSLQSIDAVLACSQSKNSARLVLLVIAHHQNRDGYAYPSIPTLMRETNLSERSVQTGIRTLQHLNELAVDYGKGPRGCNVYRILIQTEPRKDCGGRKSSPAKFSENGGQTLPPNLILKPYISDHAHLNGNGAHAPEGSMISPEVMRKFNLRHSTEDWPPQRREREDPLPGALPPVAEQVCALRKARLEGQKNIACEGASGPRTEEGRRGGIPLSPPPENRSQRQ